MGAYSPNILANCFISCEKHNGDGEIIIFGNRRITWKELTPRVFKVANTLVDLGVKRGDNVAFMFHNTPEFIEINYGIQAIGAVPAPMNYRFIPKEIEYQANHCDAKVFLYDSIWAETVEDAVPKLTKAEHLVCFGTSGLERSLDYDKLVDAARDTDPQIENEWEDVAVMIYTGGTTGFPKGVMLTYQSHLDMYQKVLAEIVIRSLTMDVSKERYKKIVETLPLPGGKMLAPILRTRLVQKLLKRKGTAKFLQGKFHDMFSNPVAASKAYKHAKKYMYPSMPFFHDAAYANLMMGSLAGNMIYVLPDSVKFDPALILGLVEKERLTGMSNVPTGWKKLVSYPEADKFDLSSIKAATTGGGLCSVPLKKQIMKLFPNAIIIDAFGQTEMTPLTSFRIDADANNIKDRAVGKSVVDVKVVDEKGNELPQGELGEILYRSSTIMKGYYKDEEKTSEVIKDGWFRSGDLGYIDEAGEIRVADRKNECINTGGEKVFPLEVEEVINNHSKVDEVCIIGVPDEEWGSTIRAVVQLKDGESVEGKEIMDFCRGEIAGYKIPRSVVFVDELPISPVGKMLRQKVRDMYGKPD